MYFFPSEFREHDDMHSIFLDKPANAWLSLSKPEQGETPREVDMQRRYF